MSGAGEWELSSSDDESGAAVVSCGPPTAPGTSGEAYAARVVGGECAEHDNWELSTVGNSQAEPDNWELSSSDGAAGDGAGGDDADDDAGWQLSEDSDEDDVGVSVSPLVSNEAEQKCVVETEPAVVAPAALVTTTSCVQVASVTLHGAGAGRQDRSRSRSRSQQSSASPCRFRRGILGWHQHSERLAQEKPPPRGTLWWVQPVRHALDLWRAKLPANQTSEFTLESLCSGSGAEATAIIVPDQSICTHYVYLAEPS